MNPALQGLLTIIVGVGGCVAYFYFSNLFLDRVLFPAKGRTPGATSTAPTRSGRGCSCSRRIFALALYLAYPVVETLRLSLTDRIAGRRLRRPRQLLARWRASRSSGRR